MNTRICSILAIVMLSGCMSINSDVEIGDGETIDGSLSTVNGSITVGAESTVRGDAETVNGGVSIGRDSTVEGNVETVNGKITLAEGARAASISGVNGPVQLGAGARIEGSAETVNGQVVLATDAVVRGQVRSVNGQIRLEGATAGAVRNNNGGIVLEKESRVLGELRVEKSRFANTDKPVTVIIHAECEVAGPLVFERPVNLQIHESATVGEIRGAEPEYFSD